MMRSILLSVLMAAFLVGFAGCGGPEEGDKPAAQTPKPGPAPPEGPAQPPGNSLDVSYVTPDFVAAVIIHPKRISKLPILAPLLAHKEIATQLQALQQMGLDPLGIERLVLLVPPPVTVEEPAEGPPPSGPTGPFGAILRFAEPVDGEKLLTAVRAMMLPDVPGDLIEVTHGSKTYYKLHEMVPVAAFIADKQTIVVADEPTLKKMLAGGGAKSPLIDRLRQVDLDNDLIVVFDLESMRETIKAELAASNKDIPPPLAPFTALPEMLKTGTLLVSLDSDQLLTLVLEANDAQSAAKVEELANSGHELAKQIFAAQRKEVPEEAREMLAPIIELVDQVLGGISVTHDDDQIVLSLKKPAALDQMGPMLAALEQIGKGLGGKKEVAEIPLDPQIANNLRQIALAMHTYHEAHGSFPPAAVRDADGKPTLSWRVALLPYLGDEKMAKMYKVFRQNEPWDSQHNTLAIKHVPDVFCSPGREKDGKTSVMVFAGPGTAFAGQKGLELAEITDGESNTIMLVVAGAEKAVPWTKPEDLPFDPDDPVAALGDLVEGGFVAAFFDGSVRMVSVDVDPQALKGLITPAGGEPIMIDGHPKPPDMPIEGDVPLEDDVPFERLKDDEPRGALDAGQPEDPGEPKGSAEPIADPF